MASVRYGNFTYERWTQFCYSALRDSEIIAKHSKDHDPCSQFPALIPALLLSFLELVSSWKRWDGLEVLVLCTWVKECHRIQGPNDSQLWLLSFLPLWKSAGFCLLHLPCTSQYKMKCSCCNLKIKHIPEDPQEGCTSVLNNLRAQSQEWFRIICSSLLKDLKPSQSQSLSNEEMKKRRHIQLAVSFALWGRALFSHWGPLC